MFGHDCSRPPLHHSFSNAPLKTHNKPHQWIPSNKQPVPIAKSNPAASPTSEGWTTVVGRGRAKGVGSTGRSGASPIVLPGSPQARPVTTSNSFSKLLPSENGNYQLEGSVIVPPPTGLLREARQVPSNPIVENKGAYEAPSTPSEEEDEECEDGFEEGSPDPTSSISARQRKRDAKFKFSGRRPKGRDRS